MSNPPKDKVQIQIEKLRDEAIACLNTLIDECVSEIKTFGDELRNRIDEELKKEQIDPNAFDEACRDTQNKINQVANQTIEKIDNGWRNSRENIEKIYSAATAILGVTSGYIEELIGQVETKVKALEKKIGEIAAKRTKEVARMVYDFKKKVEAEAKKKKK